MVYRRLGDVVITGAVIIPLRHTSAIVHLF